MSKINLSQPPYQVSCPACAAHAMAPCHVGSRMLLEPHDARWSNWGLNPSLRARVTNDTWVRWTESFQQWAARMIIHCPTARTYGELMFFAAEKLDMTTAEYFEKYFSEMSELSLNTRLLHD